MEYLERKTKKSWHQSDTHDMTWKTRVCAAITELWSSILLWVYNDSVLETKAEELIKIKLYK